MQVKCVDKNHTGRYTLGMSPRPRKKASARRETLMQLRLTESEKKMFTEAAERDHLTLSAWLRLAGLHAVQEQHKLNS
jgi:hypothetical protein